MRLFSRKNCDIIQASEYVVQTRDRQSIHVKKPTPIASKLKFEWQVFNWMFSLEEGESEVISSSGQIQKQLLEK